ncbi:glycosyl transferase [Chitinispirillum alkaliphilum]|nr:glycosyl transferase [Chitinispirillum alkaliphilum]
MKYFQELVRFLPDPEFLFLIGIWLFVFFVAGTSFPYHYDSVNYALAIVENFDIGLHQPHPPGYFFHVLLGKFLHLLINNPFVIQQVQNIIYLCAMLPCWYLIKNRKRFDLLFLGTFPLVLFFPAVPIIHAASLLFATWTALAIHKMEKGEWSPLVLGLIYSLSIGFRQDMVLMLGPVVLYALIRNKCSPKEWGLLFLMGFVVSMLWYIPTTILSNGLDPFQSTNTENFRFYESSSVFLGANLFENIRTSLRFLIYPLGVLGPGGIIGACIALRRIPLKTWIPIFLTTAPIVLYGTVFLLPFSYYYASALGFFATWILLKEGFPRSRKTMVLLSLLNLTFFWFAPGAQYNEWRGTFNERSLIENVGKQLLYSGANNRRLIVNNRDVMSFADSTIGNSCSFYVEKGIFWSRFWVYMSQYHWNNNYKESPLDAEYVMTRSEFAKKNPVAVSGGIRVYKTVQAPSDSTQATDEK